MFRKTQFIHYRFSLRRKIIKRKGNVILTRVISLVVSSDRLEIFKEIELFGCPILLAAESAGRET